MNSKSRNQSKSTKNGGKSGRGKGPRNPFPRFDVIRSGSPPIHTFTRSVAVNFVIGHNGIVPSIGIVPYLNFVIWYTQQSVYIMGNATNYITASVPGFSDLAALFDEVQIERVDMEIYPTNLELTGTAVGSANMLLCTDYNDRNSVANFSDILQYEDAKVVPLLTRSPYKETHVPKFLTYSLDSAGTSTASTPMRGFVRSNLDTDHYCRKGSFMSVPVTPQNYTAFFKYKFNCRVVK
jgi:hypothetical protein